jgi:hypothetical protein
MTLGNMRELGLVIARGGSPIRVFQIRPVTLARTNRVGIVRAKSVHSRKGATTIVQVPRHVVWPVAAHALCAVPGAAPGDLRAVPDAAPFPRSELLLLVPVSPSARWWARPTPMLQLLIPGGRTSVVAKLFHSSFHSSPPPFAASLPNDFLSIEPKLAHDPHQPLGKIGGTNSTMEAADVVSAILQHTRQASPPL